MLASIRKLEGYAMTAKYKFTYVVASSDHQSRLPSMATTANGKFIYSAPVVIEAEGKDGCPVCGADKFKMCQDADGKAVVDHPERNAARNQEPRRPTV